MSDGARGPVFLGRQSYRRRRARDAARLLPVLGAMLMLVPLLWPVAGGDGPASADGTGGTRMSRAIIYVFGVWVLLIAAAAALSVWIGRAPEEGDTGPDRDA